MKIMVCFKNVPDSEKIKVNADSTLNFDQAAPVIGQYDLNAVEAAVVLAAAVPESSVEALTIAGSNIDNTKQRKAILSRGAGKMLGVKDEAFDQADTYTIASAIAKTVEKCGDVNLLLFGEGSADMYAQQTGTMTGALLGWPTVNAVSEIRVTDGGLVVKRDLETESEVLTLQLPAVISVTSDINKPRIPSMKDILSAGKKPVEVLTAADIGAAVSGRVEKLSTLAPSQTDRKKILYESVTEEALDAIALEIKKNM